MRPLTTTAGPADRSDWTVYDDLRGPELDGARWKPAEVPVPEGIRTGVEPGARLTVADGSVTLSVERFTRSHATQSGDNVKQLMFSTEMFAVPADRPIVFAAEMGVRNIGGDPGDVRSAMATLNIVDQDASGLVFDIAATSTRVFALRERLPFADAEPFCHVVESPFVDFGDDMTRPRTCEIELDRSRGRAKWRVDGREIYEAVAEVPEQVAVGFGVFTMILVRDGVSRSLRGQGIEATWGRFRRR
jgi:Family of unknown function (DUF6081)